MKMKQVKTLMDMTYCGSAVKAGSELVMGGREADRLAAASAVEIVGDVEAAPKPKGEAPKNRRATPPETK
jgi:hypothetical protein